VGDKIEAALIVKTGKVYEVADRAGNIIGCYQDWELVANIFRQADFSEEYIANRKADADIGYAEVDELNE
jgi:hypothetical protein